MSSISAKLLLFNRNSEFSEKSLKGKLYLDKGKTIRPFIIANNEEIISYSGWICFVFYSSFSISQNKKILKENV